MRRGNFDEISGLPLKLKNKCAKISIIRIPLYKFV